MPPPPPVAAALQRFLEDVPTLDKAFFECTYDEQSHDITLSNGVKLSMDKGGYSKAKPTNIKYSFTLKPITPFTYTVWLEEPSQDPEENRRGLAIGIQNLINAAGNTKLSETVIVSAPPPA
ncbi:hypothetical protein BV20DRAFT_971040 [Pilatotrama ljubarskyi]|nr:hypothetical protein BV20DRAFT_971040 [Pilatotrama ljubarskyi]